MRDKLRMLTGLFFKARTQKYASNRCSSKIDANSIIRSGFDVLLLVVSAALLNTTLVTGLFFK